MDPLSVSASLLTLCQAGATTLKLLKKLKNLKHAPVVLESLNDEVSDLQVVAKDVEDFYATIQEGHMGLPESSLGPLERLRSKILELEHFISYELSTTAADTANIRVDKSVFLRAGPRLQKFRDDIQTHKINLVLALNLALSSQFERRSRRTDILLELLHNRLDQDDQCGYGLRSVRSGETQDAVIARSHINGDNCMTGSHLLTAPQQVLSSEADLRNTGSIPPAICSSTELVEYKTSTDNETSIVRSKSTQTHNPLSSSVALSKPVEQLTECRCPVGSNYRISSQSILSNIIGSLMITYHGSPHGCGNVRCRARGSRATCVYALPQWLLQKVIALTYTCTMSRGPELVLKVMRKRDFRNIWGVFDLPQSLALEKIKGMLDHGEASVIDVDNKGATILYHAVHYRRWNMAHLLVSYGADINYAMHSVPFSPFHIAWRYRQLGEMDDMWLDTWDKAFLQPCSTQVDVLGLTELHKAYLGLSGLRFDEVLASTGRLEVDGRDSLGKTVLHWAVDMGDSGTVDRLLKYGADADSKDLRGDCPLDYAVRLDSTTAELLLAAGANVNATNIYENIPLHYVTDPHRSLIGRMVDLGAEIERCDDTGMTPLLIACYYNKFKVAEALLACGANVNTRDKWGRTAVMNAVFRNNHQTLSMLLSKPHLDYAAVLESGRDVFDYVVELGDIGIANIMQNQWPAGISSETRISGDTVHLMSKARRRRDNDQGWSKRNPPLPDEDPVVWYEAFEDMVNTILERHAQAPGSQDRIVEIEDSDGSTDSLADGDGEEVWEDAAESHGT